MIGTPFFSEDEVTQRRVDKMNKKPWEQEVRDEKGRKRLHGAFTGGFSAGYFNTVGTKEGWTTSNFRSSRGDKLSGTNQIKKQDVMDFMDEEDIKEQIGEQTITSQDVNRDYLSSLNPYKNNEDNDNAEKFKNPNASGFTREFIPQFNNIIGSMLMKACGYSDFEYQINKENISILDDKNKYYKGKLEFKDDYYGVGYIPKFDDDIFQGKKFENIGASKNVIRMDKFEDDDESGYFKASAIVDKAKYNFEILDENYLDERERELKKKRFRDNIDINFEKNTQKFIKSTNKLHSIDNVDFKMPILPKEYNPFKEDSTESKNLSGYNIESEIEKLTNNTQEKFDSKKNFSQKLDANKRAEILDIDLEIKPAILPTSLNPYFQNKFTKAEVFDFKKQGLNQENKILYEIQQDDKKQNLSNVNSKHNNFTNGPKSAPSTIEQFNNYFHFKVEIPFKDDMNKISRFAKFAAEKEGLIVSDSTYTNTNLMTATDTKIERNQFELLYKEELRLRKEEQAGKIEIKNPHLSESDELKERIEKIKNRQIKREKTIWRPDKLVCKRFKIKEPFENKINSIVPGKSDNYSDNHNVSFKKGETKYEMSSLQYQLFKQENNRLAGSTPGNIKIEIPSIDFGKEIKVVNNEKNVFNIINSKTDINLFDEVFGD